ncbi:hypothetical protein AVEN_239789-1 [Araneus ventricosus]|uniref:Uncharacterized protein n=1 Tax=Araneus ventricosus TaxID=182803 RepID=A0A4Y2EW46_ARAVE|nr:hypothetical protein AVEN_239789-1 [Araneus ventricosus]
MRSSYSLPDTPFRFKIVPKCWSRDIETISKVEMLFCIVTVMESRFPAMQVLWLGRGFYKVKHGVTSATLVARMTLATNLATILATWRQIDYSRKCNPFLDISIRGRDLGFS